MTDQPSEADLERAADTVDADVIEPWPVPDWQVDLPPSTELEVKASAEVATQTPRERHERMLMRYLLRRDLGIKRRAEQLERTLETWCALDSLATKTVGRRLMFSPYFHDLYGVELEVAGDIYAHHWPPPELRSDTQSGAQLASNVWPQRPAAAEGAIETNVGPRIAALLRHE